MGIIRTTTTMLTRVIIQVKKTIAIVKLKLIVLWKVYVI